jgi:hypothetical protein
MYRKNAVFNGKQKHMKPLREWVCSARAKKSEFLVNLDRFSKFLKYFEKRSKLTKNSNFFTRGERATLSHHFEPS